MANNAHGDTTVSVKEEPNANIAGHVWQCVSEWDPPTTESNTCNDTPEDVKPLAVKIKEEPIDDVDGDQNNAGSTPSSKKKSRKWASKWGPPVTTAPNVGENAVEDVKPTIKASNIIKEEQPDGSESNNTENDMAWQCVSEWGNPLADAMERVRAIAARATEKCGSSANRSVEPDSLAKRIERAREMAEKLKGEKIGDNEKSGKDDATSQQQRKRSSKWEPEVDPVLQKKRLVAKCAEYIATTVTPEAHAAWLAKSKGAEVVDEVVIPKKLVKIVIGRGGEMINRIQRSSGADINVAPDPLLQTSNAKPQRKVAICGTKDAVWKAKALLEELKSTKKVPRLLWESNESMHQEEITIEDEQTAGLIIGRNGEHIKKLCAKAGGCRMTMYELAPVKVLRIFSKKAELVMEGKRLVEELLSIKDIDVVTSGNYKEIKLPKNVVGLIIGNKGATKHMIEGETGCEVNFIDPTVVDGMRSGVLKGTPEQIEAAEDKIKDIIRRGDGGPVYSTPADFVSEKVEEELESVIEVPAGRVLDHSTLRGICEESGAEVWCADGSLAEWCASTRSFHVRGTQENITKALLMMRDKTCDPSLLAKPCALTANPPRQQQQQHQQHQRQFPQGDNGYQNNSYGQQSDFANNGQSATHHHSYSANGEQQHYNQHEGYPPQANLAHKQKPQTCGNRTSDLYEDHKRPHSVEEQQWHSCRESYPAQPDQRGQYHEQEQSQQQQYQGEHQHHQQYQQHQKQQQPQQPQQQFYQQQQPQQQFYQQQQPQQQQHQQRYREHQQQQQQHHHHQQQQHLQQEQHRQQQQQHQQHQQYQQQPQQQHQQQQPQQQFYQQQHQQQQNHQPYQQYYQQQQHQQHQQWQQQQQQYQ